MQILSILITVVVCVKSWIPQVLIARSIYILYEFIILVPVS
jgi:hypothetical protein